MIYYDVNNIIPGGFYEKNQKLFSAEAIAFCSGSLRQLLSVPEYSFPAVRCISGQHGA
jgi:hypothetical protein